MWEDEENKRGGKWIVRLKKGVADRYWEDLLLVIVGDQFAEAGEEVCGAVLSVRSGEDVLSVWTRIDGGRNIKIRYVESRSESADMADRASVRPSSASLHFLPILTLFGRAMMTVLHSAQQLIKHGMRKALAQGRTMAWVSGVIPTLMIPSLRR